MSHAIEANKQAQWQESALCTQLVRLTVAEMALAYRAGHGEAALLHARLIALLSKPFLAARHDDEGSASSHLQLLLDLRHGERWQAAARVCSEVLLHTRNKVRQCVRSTISMLHVDKV